MEDYLISAVIALASSIAWLFHLILRMHEEQRKTSREIGELSGRQTGIEKLSEEVLDVVEKTTLKAFRKNEDDLS